MPGTTPCTVYGPGYYMSPQQLNTGPIAGTASHPGTVNSTPVFGVYGPGQFNSDDPNGGVIEFDAIYQACLWNAYDQYGCPQYIFGGCSTGTNVQLPDCGADGGVRHYIPYCYFLNSGENYCPDSFDFNCNPGCNVAQPPNSGC